MNTKKTAITIVAAMMAIAMITTVVMAAYCDEPCGTKVTQCTDGAPTKDAVYALMLPGVTPGVPIMQVGWADTHNPGVFDVDECAYIDTNAGAAIVQTGDVRLCACCDCPANTVVGQCTCTGYTELGRALFIPNQLMVGYVDMDSDGVYSLPDFLYLDMNTDGFVSEADIRLTAAFGYPAYSVVTNGEAEVPVPNLSPMPLLDPVSNTPTGVAPARAVNDYLGFVDSGCDGQWTVNGEDKLYLQQLVLWPLGSGVHRNQFDAFVTIGDLRLYMPPNEDCWPNCGTKVMQCAPDAVYALLIPGVDTTNSGGLVPAMQFRWVDTNGNQFFDPADHAYIDTLPGPANVEAGDIRLTVTCDPDCGPNTMVGVCGTCDLSPVQPFAALTQQDVVGYFDMVDAHTGIPNGVYDLGDPLYLDIGGINGFITRADGVISPGDIRLTEAFGYPAWSIVMAGNDDCPVSVPARLPLSDPVSNLPMVPPDVANDGILLNELLGFVDSDCNYVWDDDADDKLYLQQAVGNLNAPAAPQFQFDMFATIGDLRLFIDDSKVGSGPGEPCWLECGTKVKECDVDAVYGLTIPGVTPLRPTTVVTVSAMQFGYVDKDGNGRFSVTEGSSPDHQDCAYIDTNILPGAPRVAVGDVRLCSCCGEKPNTVVRECDIDEIGQLLTIPTIAPWGQVGLVGYVDVNSDPFLPGYDVGEPLYIDCGGLPIYADGMVSEGDIRLTGRTDHGMNYLPYSVVDSEDDDVLGSLNSVLLDPMTDVPTIDIVNGITGGPTFNDYLGFRDSNCDGIWDIYGDDELYLQQIVEAPSFTALPREFQFNLFSTIGDFRIYMNDTIGSGPCDLYDTNGTPGIQKDEVLDAIGDYFTPGTGTTKETVLAVIGCYFSP